MRKDPTEFRKRFAKWKAGAKPYQYGIPYEDDNHNTDYDQARANQLNYSADETGHYPTRDYETGRYLKSPTHPTVTLGTYTDMGLGYDVWYNKKDKSLYSQPNFTSTYKDRLPKYQDGGELVNGGELPEVVVNGYSPLRLTTYYIGSPQYPLTGHSKLDIPIDRKTWNDYVIEDPNTIISDRVSPYMTIDKSSNAKDYNLVTNNCADATLGYLNKAFGTNESTFLFTTPGDVRDYALNKLKGKLIKNSDGSDTVLIPRNSKNAKKLSVTALDMFKDDLSGTAGVGYKGPFSYTKNHTKILPKHLDGKERKFVGSTPWNDLPKFEGGEEKFKPKKTPEFVQAGKDNSWSKVTNDNMGEVFQNVVARPNRTGGNISAGSWKKLWEPKLEKGLEIVSPEFDLVSLGVGSVKELKHLKLFKRVIKNPNTSGDQLRYDLYDWKGRSKGRINVHTYDNTPEVGYVESKIPGGSRALYDAVIEDVTNRGMPGLYSGRDLLSAPKTYSVWKHYKDKLLIGRYGTHNNLRMPGVDGTVSFSGDYNKMLLNWKNNIADGFYNGEVYLLKTPSQKAMSSPYLPRIDNLMTGIGNPLAGHLFTKYAE